MRNLIAKFIKTYFDPDLELHIQSFNLLAIAGVAVGVITGVDAAVAVGLLPALINFLAAALAAGFLLYARKTGSHRLCSLITVALVFFIAFPVLFFTSGGYRGGMPAFFIFAVMFTALMLERRVRIAAVAAEFLLYTACCVAAYKFPDMVTQFSEWESVRDVVVGMLCASISLLLVVVLYLRIYNNRQARLAALDKLKTEFLGNVSHEMKTPLTVISSYAQLSAKGLAKQPGEVSLPQLQKNLKLIESEAGRLSLMVSQILDVTRIEEGRFVLRPRPDSLCGIIAETLDTYYPAFSKNRSSLVFEPPEEDVRVLCNPDRIAQVLVNLVSNAAQHTQNGAITIRVSADRDFAAVEVADTGEGMGEEQLARLFGRYSTGAEIEKAGGGRNTGTGLGLYICRHILEEHGGEITVRSEVGKGTSVRFTLPRA